jgi:uncharacterized protein YbjT (DUF2867 family)/uncharacterized protein YndB with AHSA1/START domain
MMSNQPVLVTGATGYIGGRLVPALLEKGYAVRVFVRSPARLAGRSWVDRVDVVQGDVLVPETLGPALEGIQAAYYLIHSMQGSDDFHRRDLIAARNFSRAAHKAGVERIIYLGGLGDPEADLSEHLKSRQETGQALTESGVPVTEFRAAIIVGSGSISFEMIRYLTERLPVMICPQWVYTHVQPIAIADMLAYLTAALETPESVGKIIEVGGADVLTYGEMMEGYAEMRDLKRWLIPVPVLTPGLSSHWVHWMTPVSASITRPLIEGLRNEVVVRDDTARELFPDIQPVGYRSAVKTALSRLEAGQVETRWSDALCSSQGEKVPVALRTQEGMIIERREVSVEVPPEQVFQVFTSLGGERGWLYLDWSWRLRGILDRLVGGAGLRRGRRDPKQVRVGDAVDFWRVEAVEQDHLLRLRAEMKLPGRAWLQFEVESRGEERTGLKQTAFFAPRGLAGFLYWYTLYPLHSLVFSGLIRKIKEEAEELN